MYTTSCCRKTSICHDDFPVFYQIEQFRHGRFVIVGIGERVDEEVSSDCDEIVFFSLMKSSFKGSERTFKGSERTFKGSERTFKASERTFKAFERTFKGFEQNFYGINRTFI